MSELSAVSTNSNKDNKIDGMLPYSLCFGEREGKW